MPVPLFDAFVMLSVMHQGPSWPDETCFLNMAPV